MARVNEITTYSSRIKGRPPIDRYKKFTGNPIQNFTGNPLKENMVNERKQNKNKQKSPIRQRFDRKSRIDNDQELDDSSRSLNVTSNSDSESESENSSVNRSNRTYDSFDTARTFESFNTTTFKHSTVDNDKNREMLIFISVCVFVIIGIFSHIYCNTNADEKTENNISEIKSGIEKIKNVFPPQSSELWTTIASGIFEAGSLEKLRVFVLAYNESADTSRKLAQNIAKLASSVLNAENEEPLELNAIDLNTNHYIEDHGRFVTDWSGELEKRRSMIIFDVDKMAARIARSLHSFCDEFNPLVQPSVIIFTLKVNVSETDNEVKMVEEKLTKRWEYEMDTDKLVPLVTRMTASVLKVAN